MNSVARIVASAGVLAVLAGAAIYLMQEAPPAAPTPVHQEPRAQDPSAPAPANVTGEQQAKDTTPIGRHEEDVTSGKEQGQGVTGRVVMPGGAPCANAIVFLMPSATANALQAWIEHQQGRTTPPTAQGRTDQDGRFRLGTGKVDGVHDLRVITDAFPELNHRSFKIRNGEWYDAGELRLVNGVVVQGRVVQEGSLAAVPGAQVYLQSSNDGNSMQAAPGREKGMPALTDNSGSFRYTNAPRDTTIKLVVEATGFAKVEKLNLVLQQDVTNEFNIELAIGLPMAGVVRNSAGAGVANAQVTAVALSAKMPQAGETRTDGDGRFELQGLREGAYQVTVAADQYDAKTERPVQAGNTDVVIVLDQRGAARVRVLASNGKAIKDFTLSLKNHFPNNPVAIGNVLGFRDRRITPADFKGDMAEVQGIPNGQFVFQIAAAEHARTLSGPFTVVAGGAVPDVIVQMTLGGTISGRVVDDRGAPVAGAVVATDLPGAALLADSPLKDIFGHLMPDQITKTSVRSGGDGSFRLPRLAYGEYMLRAAHADFCERTAQDLRVESDAEVKVGDLVLARGTIVQGVCSVQGRATAQVKVTISPPENALTSLPADGKAKVMFTATALSDNDGNYRFSKRVPPGTWRIHANREAGNGDIFGPLMDIKQTQRELVISPGQLESAQNFNIAVQ